MSEWRKFPLGDLVTFLSGGTPSKMNPSFWNGDVPWISARTMKNERISTSELMITEEGLIAGSKLAPTGSLLLLIRGSGLFNGIPLCIVERPVAFNQDIKCIESKSDVSNRFIFYWLKSQERYLRDKLDVTGIGAGKFDTRFLQELIVLVPPSNVRERIVAIADAISEQIVTNTKINDNLQQQARVLLAQWMAENEGNYEICSLSNVAETNPDTYSPKDAWEYVNYLDTSSITDGIISEVQHIDPSTEKLPSRARRIISANDVVFSTVRPNQRHFGIICEPISNMLASTGFAVIRSKHPNVSNEVLYLCLTESGFVEKMQQLAEQSTSTFPSIKPSDLGTCEIPCPVDQCLSDTLKAMFACIASNQRENSSLATLRDTLLPKLLAGEIDVSAIDF